MSASPCHCSQGGTHGLTEGSRHRARRDARRRRAGWSARVSEVDRRLPAWDGWQLVAVADLGITPEEATGIASLDGNGDGMTCIKPQPNFPKNPGAFTFRDNTAGP